MDKQATARTVTASEASEYCRLFLFCRPDKTEMIIAITLAGVSSAILPVASGRSLALALFLEEKPDGAIWISTYADYRCANKFIVYLQIHCVNGFCDCERRLSLRSDCRMDGREQLVYVGRKVSSGIVKSALSLPCQCVPSGKSDHESRRSINQELFCKVEVLV